MTLEMELLAQVLLPLFWTDCDWSFRLMFGQASGTRGNDLPAKPQRFPVEMRNCTKSIPCSIVSKTESTAGIVEPIVFAELVRKSCFENSFVAIKY
jgi:hypothetical protein